MPNFSKQEVSVADVTAHRSDVENSLRLYYSANNTTPRFIGYSALELQKELDVRLTELNLTSMLVLLSAVEAAFRVDYTLRCYKGPVDGLSSEFRKLRKRKKDRVNLEKEILETWRTKTNVDERLIGQLRGAFKLRHWIAHGRYWTPSIGQPYDFFSLQALASQTFAEFPFITA